MHYSKRYMHVKLVDPLTLIISLSCHFVDQMLHRTQLDVGLLTTKTLTHCTNANPGTVLLQVPSAIVKILLQMLCIRSTRRALAERFSNACVDSNQKQTITRCQTRTKRRSIESRSRRLCRATRCSPLQTTCRQTGTRKSEKVEKI